MQNATSEKVKLGQNLNPSNDAAGVDSIDLVNKVKKSV